MFRNVFTEALATIPRYEWHPKISLYIRSFNIVLGEFPDVDELDEGKWDAMVVTGTRKFLQPINNSAILHRRKRFVDGRSAQVLSARRYCAPACTSDWYLLRAPNHRAGIWWPGHPRCIECRGTFTLY